LKGHPSNYALVPSGIKLLKSCYQKFYLWRPKCFFAVFLIQRNILQNYTERRSIIIASDARKKSGSKAFVREGVRVDTLWNFDNHVGEEY